MTLIAILFCFALQRFANVGNWMQPTWFESYLKRLQPWLIKVNELVGISIILIPIFILLAILHLLLNWRFFGFFDLIFIVMILLFCVDARDLKQKLANYFSSLEKQNQADAVNAAALFVGSPILYEANELPRAVTKAIFVKVFTDIFSVLFWFIIFGTYGAVGYVSLVLTSKFAPKIDLNFTNLARVAEQMIEILDWIPVRLLGFTYALVGHFTKGCSYCVKNFWLNPKDNASFIVNSGFAALDLTTEATQSNEKENYVAIDLINRALIVWIIAIAIFSLGYWL